MCGACVITMRLSLRVAVSLSRVCIGLRLATSKLRLGVRAWHTGTRLTTSTLFGLFCVLCSQKSPGPIYNSPPPPLPDSLRRALACTSARKSTSSG